MNMHILRKLCPDIDTICGSSGNVNYKRQLKETFPEPEFQVDIKVVYRMKINSLKLSRWWSGTPSSWRLSPLGMRLVERTTLCRRRARVPTRGALSWQRVRWCLKPSRVPNKF